MSLTDNRDDLFKKQVSRRDALKLGGSALLGAGAGWRGQQPLWLMIRSGQLILADTSATMLARMPALMEQYKDLPMDLADASLVALAEEQGLHEMFTLDRDFRVYRLPGGQAFIVVP